jgi:tripartite-type tricarboxylate transporter receptor subunit TctC
MKKPVLVALALLFGTTGAAMAQSAYPNRAVNVIVSAGAGGGTDIIARLVGQELSSMWHQPVVVENKTGGGGNIAGQYVARSKPDGYTLFVTFGGVITINPYLYNHMGFDPIKDLAPITNLATAPYVLAINPRMVPARTVKDFVAFAKASPKRLTWASTAKGSPDHLAGELFGIMTDLKMTHVPYKGGAAALLDVLGDRIPFGFFTIPTSLPYLKSGKLIGLGISSKKPSTLLPEVKPLADSLPGYEVLTWYGIWAPAGTPAEIINKINADVKKVLQSAAVRDRLVSSGYDVVGNSPSEFASFIQNESDKYGRIISRIGLKKN